MAHGDIALPDAQVEHIPLKWEESTSDIAVCSSFLQSFPRDPSVQLLKSFQILNFRRIRFQIQNSSPSLLSFIFLGHQASAATFLPLKHCKLSLLQKTKPESWREQGWKGCLCGDFLWNPAIDIQCQALGNPGDRQVRQVCTLFAPTLKGK